MLSFKKFCSSVSSLETIVKNLVTLNRAFKPVLHIFEYPNSYDSSETDRCHFGGCSEEPGPLCLRAERIQREAKW